MPIELINKLVSIIKPVLKDVLIFLVEAYLKPVLGNPRKIGYCRINFCNIYIKLYRVSVEI